MRKEFAVAFVLASFLLAFASVTQAQTYQPSAEGAPQKAEIAYSAPEIYGYRLNPDHAIPTCWRTYFLKQNGIWVRQFGERFTSKDCVRKEWVYALTKYEMSDARYPPRVIAPYIAATDSSKACAEMQERVVQSFLKDNGVGQDLAKLIGIEKVRTQVFANDQKMIPDEAMTFGPDFSVKGSLILKTALNSKGECKFTTGEMLMDELAARGSAVLPNAVALFVEAHRRQAIESLIFDKPGDKPKTGNQAQAPKIHPDLEAPAAW